MSFLPKAAVAASEETSTDTDLHTEIQVEEQPKKSVSSALSPLPDLSISNNRPLFSEPTLSIQPEPSPVSDSAPAVEKGAIASSSLEFVQLRDRLFGTSAQPLPAEIAQATAPATGTSDLPILPPAPGSTDSTPAAPLPVGGQPAPPGTPSNTSEPGVLDPNVLDPNLAAPATTAPLDASELEINTIPDSLFADPNPLTFPTTTEEVTIEQTPVVTIEQAIELAYRNNQSLQAALLSQEQAAAAVREARAELFPNVDIAANSTTQESTRPTNVAGLGAVGEPSGADTTISGSAEVNYDILTGGSRRASIRAAELQEQISTLAVEVQQEQIRLNTANAYYDLQNAGEQIRINQSFLEEAARNLRDSRLRTRGRRGYSV